MLENFINCGERKIQGDFRISVMDICKNNSISNKDTVEVFIKKVEK